MTIQGCPVEVLDNIFEYTAYLAPRNAQATLYSLMLTCSHFHAIAKRHFIRIVCLQSASKVNSFFYWLNQVVESGDYGKGVLPIQHLAVAGESLRGRRTRSYYDTEAKAYGVLHSIITTAAPSLLTLTIFDVEDRWRICTGLVTYSERSRVTPIPDDTTFPKLRDLIVLRQHVIHLVLRDDNGKPDTRACQLRYPSLRRLYTPAYGGGALPSTLPYLDDLRLLDNEYGGPPPREELGHVRTLIIDVPKHYNDYDDYLGDRTFMEYHTLIKKVGNPERNGIVVPTRDSILSPERGLILSAWANAVVGGEGCWTTAWAPTGAPTGTTTRLRRETNIYTHT